MSQQPEIQKLLNVLEQIESAASAGQWGDNPEEAIRYCVTRFNRVFDRLKELDPGLASIFEPLEENSPPSVIAMACRQVISWFDDRTHASSGWEHIRENFDSEQFNDFWRRGGKGLEELGETIRQTIEIWSGKFPEATCRTRGNQADPKPTDD